MKKLLIVAALLVSGNAFAGPSFNPRDVARVIAAPTDTNCESFDLKYGHGATARVLSQAKKGN